MNFIRVFTAIALLVSEVVVARDAQKIEPIQDGGIVELAIDGEVTIETYNYLAANINRPGVKLVFIDIDSPGGSLGAATRTVDLFKLTSAKIVCTDKQLAASAAMVIFQACDVRAMEPDATMIAHGAKFEIGTKMAIGHQDAIKLAEALHEMNRLCVELMLGRTTMSPTLALQLFDDNVDMTIDASSALEMGAVDLVLPRQE